MCTENETIDVEKEFTEEALKELSNNKGDEQ